MGTTTFNGPVRSEKGFQVATKNTTTGAVTTGGTATLSFDCAGSDVYKTGSIIESRGSSEVSFDSSAASETLLTFTPANAATNLLTTGCKLYFVCYEKGTWTIAYELATETTQVTGAFVFAS